MQNMYMCSTWLLCYLSIVYSACSTGIWTNMILTQSNVFVIKPTIHASNAILTTYSTCSSILPMKALVWFVRDLLHHCTLVLQCHSLEVIYPCVLLLLLNSLSLFFVVNSPQHCPVNWAVSTIWVLYLVTGMSIIMLAWIICC